MATQTNGKTLWQIRHARKDVGVALVAAAALLGGWILFRTVDTQVRSYNESGEPLRISIPAHWTQADNLQTDVLFASEDPETNSLFKTGLVVARRDLDPAAPPTLQALADRRVTERAALNGYHFLNQRDLTVAGERAIELSYAYTAQPLDEPRRPALPVVVVARDVIVLNKTSSYYLTLTAPESDYERASARFDAMLQSVRLQ
jgi:hypothetical protein